ERQRLFTMPKTDNSHPCKTDAFRKFVTGLLTIQCPMDVDEAAATFQIRIDIRRTFVIPVAVLEEDDDVGLLELFSARPLPSRGDLRVLRRGKQFRPHRLKRRIIVLADSMIFRTRNQHDLDWPGRFGWRRRARKGGAYLCKRAWFRSRARRIV